MKTLSPLLARTAVVSGLALGAFAMIAVAGTFVAAPPPPPPNCPDVGYEGCHPPLNNDYGTQIKQGGLYLKGLKSGSTAMSYGLLVETVPIKASGGLIIQTCSTTLGNCPDSGGVAPEPGRMWLAQ